MSKVSNVDEQNGVHNFSIVEDSRLRPNSPLQRTVKWLRNALADFLALFSGSQRLEFAKSSAWSKPYTDSSV